MSQPPVVLRVSNMTDQTCNHLSQLLKHASIANRLRSKLEKLLTENGFEVDISQGKLDPKMADLFPGCGVNVLEKAAKLLADNPWQNIITYHSGQEQPERNAERIQKMIRAGFICGQITIFLEGMMRKYEEISPQPSEEAIAEFKAAVLLVSVKLKKGVYCLSSHGRISQHNYGEVFPPLLHSLKLDFSVKSKTGTVAILPDLETAIAIRDRMKAMVTIALEAYREREDRRKIPSK